MTYCHPQDPREGNKVPSTNIYRRVQQPWGGQARDKSYLASSATHCDVPLLMPHESFKGLQSMYGGCWSALVESAVNYSLTQHRVAFPDPHPTPYTAFRNVPQDCVPYPGGCHHGHPPRPGIPFRQTTTPALILSPLPGPWAFSAMVIHH